REVQQSASDPMPRLKYAETLFAAGEIDAAVEKLDQAIQLLGGVRSMRAGAARDRVFARALAFAERAAEPKIGASDPARATALFDRAAAAAQSPQQQVAWRLSRARFAHTQHDFAGEVGLYQQILADTALRGALVPGGDDGGAGATPAAEIAEARIRQCVHDNPSSYAAFEKSAEEALSAAKGKSDPAAMLAVAHIYPNARCAPTAMLSAADAYEAAGKFRQATQIL